MKKKNSVKKVKSVKVDRKFLLKLANTIYNPKTKEFLRLCTGKLQNGPDPANEERSMHCALGELYFEMTQRQPNEDHVEEDDVVDLAVKNSFWAKHDLSLKDLQVLIEKSFEDSKKKIRSLKLPSPHEETLLEALNNEAAYGDSSVFDEDELEFFLNDSLDPDIQKFINGLIPNLPLFNKAKKFRQMLMKLPDVNDGSGSFFDESDSSFEERSKAVATNLRKAAMLLPK